MRVTFKGEPNIDKLAKVLNEVFKNLDFEEIEKIEKEEQQNKEYLKAG
jgi:hypothetical protein